MIHQTSGQRKFLDCPAPSVSSLQCLCREKIETSYTPGPELTTIYSNTFLPATITKLDLSYTHESAVVLRRVGSLHVTC